MATISEVSTTWTTCYSQGELHPIEVQVLVRTGIPRFDIIGLPQNMIREGRDRITSALARLGIDLKTHRVLVSLNPGDLPKEGSHFDLPILVGILRATGLLKSNSEREFYWGEVSLTGSLQPLPDLVAHLLYADQMGATLLTSSPRNEDVDFLRPNLNANLRLLEDVGNLLQEFIPQKNSVLEDPDSSTLKEWIENTPEQSSWDQLRGSPAQFLTWCLIMLGRHHILLQGSPGCGKTTWCRAAALLQMPLKMKDWNKKFHFQPQLSERLKNLEDLTRPPFEAPHHTATRASILGGGSGQIVSGAISRAHGGILFLDELMEFSRDCLEGLREPLETKRITVSRQGAVKTLDANIQLLAAMNPCKCGAMGSRYFCRCSTSQFNHYQQKLSGPLKDRIHLNTWWEFKDLERPDDYSLKNIRRRFVECPDADEIEFDSSEWKDARNARDQRNRSELFTSWCRWFNVTKPKNNDIHKFLKFFEPLELNDEKLRNYRTAI